MESDRLVRLAEHICAVAFRPSTVDLMRLVIAESKRFPRMMRELIQATDARFRATVRKVFDELAERGLVDDSETAASAEMFIHLVLGDTPLYIHVGWNAAVPTKQRDR